MAWSYWIYVVALAALLISAARLCVAQPSKSVIAIPDRTVIAKRQAEVVMLRQLSSDSAVQQPDMIPDAASLAARFAAQTAKEHAYASWACIRDREKAKLARGDFAVIAWAFDFVEPDAAHVMQTAWDGDRYVYDEWIEIKKSKFVKLGAWMEVPPGHAGFLDSFVLQTYATVLRNERPISARTYLHSGRRYVLLEYEIAIAAVFTGLSDDPKVLMRLELWIDSSSGLLAKAIGRAQPGKPPFEFEQEFVGYADEIRIVAPPHTTLAKPVEHAGSPAEFTSPDEMDAFMQAYYQSPKPDRIGALIKSLETLGPSLPPAASPPFAGFLSEVFRTHPKDVDTWRKSVGAPNSRAAEIVSLATDLTNHRNGVLDIREVSATTNDMCWGAFFASGDRQYLDKLISELALYDVSRYPQKSTSTAFDNKADFDSFTAGATAAWSLSANLEHSTVKQAVVEAERGAQGREREVLHEVLTKSPGEIRAEVNAIMNQRRGGDSSQSELYPGHR